jgi:hypothetical protein
MQQYEENFAYLDTLNYKYFAFILSYFYLTTNRFTFDWSKN